MAPEGITIVEGEVLPGEEPSVRQVQVRKTSTRRPIPPPIDQRSPSGKPTTH